MRQKQLIKDFLSKDEFILIILDACRFDYFQKYCEIEGKLRKVVSEGSNTGEWFSKTFDKHYNDVTYVSANPQINKIGYRTDANERFQIVEVWKWGWSHYNGIPTVPAEEVVEGVHKAIKSNSKVIAHFMQPHPPFVGETPLAKGIFNRQVYKAQGSSPQDSEDVKEAGDVDRDLLKKAYADNLKYVLNEGVRPLLSRYNGFDIVITSDHGQLLGGNGGHPKGSDDPLLREVPWLNTQLG